MSDTHPPVSAPPATPSSATAAPAATAAAPAPTARWTLVTRHLGWEVRVFDSIDSTNHYALSLAHDPKLHGLVALARSQSAGRGQFGRTWTAAPDSSVLMSVILFPPAPLRRPAVMIAWAAVAVCDVLEHIAEIPATIKWPNDILVGGKKICGFLVQQRTTGFADTPLASVVGVGLNINQTAADFAVAGLPDAASMRTVTGREFSIDALARSVVYHLDESYDRLLSGDLSTLESLWQFRLGLLGKPVVAETAAGPRRGLLLDVGFGGVTLRDGVDVVQLAPEVIRHLSAGG